MMSSATWDGQDHHMASGPDDEFHQFLDMSSMGSMGSMGHASAPLTSMGDGMQFDFHGFQPASSQPADAIMGESANSTMLSRSDGLLTNHTPAMSSSVSQPSVPAHMMGTSAPSEAINSIDAQILYLQQQKFQQQQRHLHEQHATFFSNHNHSVPPTPQSIEMPPGSGQFYSQPEQVRQQGIYDGGYHQRVAEHQDMTFTPLVSPAVTPLDPHFNMENAFTVPGGYFSPLTSPALHAQNDLVSGYDNSTHSNNSPVEMDLEITAPPVATGLDLSKKARKNNAAKARTKPSVKSSPISKPQRKKTGPSPAIVSQVLNEVDERSMQTGESALLPLPAASTDGSEENASVSPENLTDMPPPPVPGPRSTSKSPYIQAQNDSTQKTPPASSSASFPAPVDGQQPHPATPASLMKLPASRNKRTPSTAHQDHGAIENIESFELPESLSNRPLVPQTSQSPRIQPGPRKEATFHPPPSPSTKASGTASANQSPLLLPGSTGPSARKTPVLASRNSRKRSMSSVHVSPALLPRISPNIKPLLPGTPGMSAEDTASRLLMSKSNYQNILEGNTVPGVSYPSELSTNLTSKRTSHKIAEQGRRNRINSALQVMAGLLPEHHKVSSVEEETDKKDGKGITPSSKASVVENAITHMQTLERENGNLKQQLKDLNDQLEKLKG